LLFFDGMELSIETRRRRLREAVGWGILAMVVNLSRLAVWMDDALGDDWR